MTDYSHITHNQMVAAAIALLASMTPKDIIAIPGIWKVISEEYNNDLLEIANGERAVEPQPRALATINVLQAIIDLGGNLSDSQLGEVGGINDGRDRAIKFVAARHLARIEINRLKTALSNSGTGEEAEPSKPSEPYSRWRMTTQEDGTVTAQWETNDDEDRGYTGYDGCMGHDTQSYKSRADALRIIGGTGPTPRSYRRVYLDGVLVDKDGKPIENPQSFERDIT